MTAQERREDTAVTKMIRIAAISAILSLLATAAAIMAILVTTQERHTAANDSCHLLRGLVFSATTGAPKQRAAATAYVNRTPLADCHHYADSLAAGIVIRRGHHHHK